MAKIVKIHTDLKVEFDAEPLTGNVEFDISMLVAVVLSEVVDSEGSVVLNVFVVVVDSSSPTVSVTSDDVSFEDSRETLLNPETS